MEYTLEQCDEKLKQFADKMGSDYFPLPVLLNFFQSATLDFIGDRLRVVEKTQEVVDDIRGLILTGSLNVSTDPDDSSRYLAAVPVNYLRLVAYDIIYNDGSRCRRADLVRHAEYTHNQNNPNRKPNKKYPVILQENNMFFIDAGDAIPDKMKLSYCKKPTFALPSEKQNRIVNLSDDAIEKVLLMTVTRLFNRSADQRTQSNYQIQESFRKVFQ